MKKTILAFGILIASLVLAAQNTITLTLGSTDITYLAPGDTVYVPIICTDIGPNNIITGAQYTFEMDPAVISWTGNFTTNFGNPNDWMFFYSGDQMIALSGFGFASPGMTLISFEFIYQGGQTPLTWGYSEVYDENFDYYYVTIIGYACICDLPDYAVTFHVTADDEDLQGAIITIGNLWLETDENGLATFSLSDGQYDYTVTKPGYADEEGSFTVAGAPVDIEVEMVECYDVTFNVIPADSTIIIINGDTLVSGETICLPNGDYWVTVLNPGYYPFEGLITVASAPLSIEIILDPQLIEVTFFVNCCGEPLSGIPITINGYTIITPETGIVVFSLIPGNYSVLVGGYTFTITGTTYIDADVCSEVTFEVTDEMGQPLEGVSIEVNSDYFLTDISGVASTCLQVGTYSYSASKPGFISQTGTFEMDTIPQTVGIVMSLTTWEVSFNITGYECDNEFEELLVIANGDTMFVGQTIFLPNGNFTVDIAIEGCPPLVTTSIVIDNGPQTFEINIEDFPKVYIAVEGYAGMLPGVEVIVDDEDTLYTNYNNIGFYCAEFCVTGGNHWIYFPDYAIWSYFTFECTGSTYQILQVGLNEYDYPKDSLTITIYPNPSKGRFYFELQNQVSEPLEIQVLDLTGRVVYSGEPANTKKTEINLSDQPTGMYFVRVKTEDKFLIRKIVIQ